MEVAFKKIHKHAKVPHCDSADRDQVCLSVCDPYRDAGFDITAVECKYIVPGGDDNVICTGLEVADITPGWWLRVEARSGLGFKENIIPFPGVIDNGYRGEIKIKMFNLGFHPYKISTGDRIAQLVPYQMAESVSMKLVEEKTETKRGSKGFGSSGV